MRGELTNLVMQTVLMSCPLCKEKYRLRVNLFSHIRGEHTLLELQEYLKKKRIKIKYD